MKNIFVGYENENGISPYFAGAENGSSALPCWLKKISRTAKSRLPLNCISLEFINHISTCLGAGQMN